MATTTNHHGTISPGPRKSLQTLTTWAGLKKSLLHTSFRKWWYLLGGIPTPKNMKLSVGMMTFPTEWKVIIHSCSKPPTRIWIIKYTARKRLVSPLIFQTNPHVIGTSQTGRRVQDLRLEADPLRAEATSGITNRTDLKPQSSKWCQDGFKRAVYGYNIYIYTYIIWYDICSDLYAAETGNGPAKSRTKRTDFFLCKTRKCFVKKMKEWGGLKKWRERRKRDTLW